MQAPLSHPNAEEGTLAKVERVVACDTGRELSSSSFAERTMVPTIIA